MGFYWSYTPLLKQVAHSYTLLLQLYLVSLAADDPNLGTVLSEHVEADKKLSSQP